MKPAARVQAAIELLDLVIEGATNEGAPADRLISAYFRERRYAGSKDRRAVRELVYRAIRACGEVPANGRAAMLALAQADAALASLFDGSDHGPASVVKGEVVAELGEMPRWLEDALADSGVGPESRRALLDRAPLDVRVNTLKSDREGLELPEAGEYLDASQGLRFPSGTQVEQWDSYKEGKFEVQDHGSQLVCLAANARPGETVIDLCAGAGGKTLAMAAAMENKGELIACDSDRRRLAKLRARATRAGVEIITERLLNPTWQLETIDDFVGRADLVLVDAPCSGSGTWRRKPEAKWRLTPERLARFSALQDQLLDVAAKLTRREGRIAFVTCSLLDQEGTDRISGFLARHTAWQSERTSLPLGRPHGEGTRLDPFHDGTDGFFIAIQRSS